MMIGWMVVVAGALQREDGRWLLYRRPEGRHHAGLWEFPGGKVEANEMPLESLVRELAEELGIRCRPEACTPFTFAETGAGATPGALVILLYTVAGWEGEPAAVEGGAIGWFTPAEALALPKPPLDILLATQLFADR